MQSVFCNKCFETVSVYSQMDCGHMFCHDCIDPNDEYFKCFKCKSNRRRYVEKMSIVTDDELNKCILCEDKMKGNSYPFSCGHPFCETCLSTFWVSMIKEGYYRMLHQFNCMHCQKSHHMSQDRLQKLLPITLFMLIKDRELTKNLVGCQNCSHVWQFNRHHQNYNCPKCNSQICPVCLNIHLEGQQKCNHIDYKDIFNNVLGQDVRYCPHCFDPFMKDAQCDHVTCINCRKQFCYFCMADYIPIRGHGNSRHRRDCRNYVDANGVIHECINCGVDCRTPNETMQEFVERHRLYVNANYRDFNSAPGWEGNNDHDDVDMHFFD